MSLGYFGYVAGSLFSLIVGDLMGRKRLMLLNLMMTLVGLGSTVLSLNLMMAGVGMLFASAGVRNCFNACFYFIAETVNEKKR